MNGTVIGLAVTLEVQIIFWGTACTVTKPSYIFYIALMMMFNWLHLCGVFISPVIFLKIQNEFHGYNIILNVLRNKEEEEKARKKEESVGVVWLFHSSSFFFFLLLSSSLSTYI